MPQMPHMEIFTLSNYVRLTHLYWQINLAIMYHLWNPAMNPICLIIPPSIFLLDERVFMTLGILRVAAVLEEAGIQVEMLDLSGVENYEEVVRDHVRNGSVTCYGLTATT